MFPIRDSQPSYATPLVTLLLVAVNCFLFFHQVTLDAYSRNHWIAEFALIPDQPSVADLFTSMFLHAGWMHLIGNMWFLWIFGDNVEDIMGRGRFLLFYLVCGVAAGLTHLLVNPYSRVPTVGASGAIAGVMGAYMRKFPHARIHTIVFVILILPVEIPAVVMLGYWFLIQLFSGVGTIGYSHLSQGGVAWWAHAGGFLAGMLLVNLFVTRRRYHHRRDVYW